MESLTRKWLKGPSRLIFFWHAGQQLDASMYSLGCHKYSRHIKKINCGSRCHSNPNEKIEKKNLGNAERTNGWPLDLPPPVSPKDSLTIVLFAGSGTPELVRELVISKSSWWYFCWVGDIIIELLIWIITNSAKISPTRL